MTDSRLQAPVAHSKRIKPTREALTGSVVRVVVVTVILGLHGPATACGPQALIDLGRHLQQLRSMPVGSDARTQCPGNTDSIKGIPFAAVLEHLAEPDHASPGAFTYFLSPPRAGEQRGGGFPELTFTTDSSGAVETITCTHAR